MLTGFALTPLAAVILNKIGARKSIVIGMVILLAGFWKAPSFGALMVVGPVLGFSVGTMIIMMTAMIPNYYSPEAFPSIRGIVSPPRTIITANFPAVAGYVADRTGTYDTMFQILIACLVVSLMLSPLLSPPEKKQVSS
jgi:MFS family permease